MCEFKLKVENEKGKEKTYDSKYIDMSYFVKGDRINQSSNTTMTLNETLDGLNLNLTQREMIEQSFAQQNVNIKELLNASINNSMRKKSLTETSNNEVMTFSNGLSIKYRFIITYANPNEDF